MPASLDLCSCCRRIINFKKRARRSARATVSSNLACSSRKVTSNLRSSISAAERTLAPCDLAVLASSNAARLFLSQLAIRARASSRPQSPEQYFDSSSLFPRCLDFAVRAGFKQAGLAHFTFQEVCFPVAIGQRSKKVIVSVNVSQSSSSTVHPYLVNIPGSNTIRSIHHPVRSYQHILRGTTDRIHRKQS